jgi:polysaccharide pyruvyl transferase WcaK-like protein
MKIGILSMHRVKNWGSFLQAFALKKVIESLGHDCSFLDVKPRVGLTKSEIAESEKYFLYRKLTKPLRALTHVYRGTFQDRLRTVAFQKQFESKYDEVFLPILGVDPRILELDKTFDIVVIGSDEVFNCTQKTVWGKTLHLFGEEVDARKIISYAASFGHTDFPALEKSGLEPRVKQALANFSSLSVRDENSYNLIVHLTGRPPKILADPVLIYDFEPLLPAAVPTKDYIIIYSYPGRISDPETIQAIRDYAKQKNKAIVSLFGYYRWADESIIAEDPFELLAYFRDADYVITDTFHGTILSAKYHKNFCVFVRESNEQKLGFLLFQLGLSDRVVAESRDVRRVLDQEIDYTDTNAIVKAEKERAYTYLRGALRSC